jgi:hypothetical protein
VDFPSRKTWIVSPVVPVEVVTITTKVVAAVLSKDIVDVLEKLALEVVVAVYSQCAGMVVCLRIRLLPSTMF